MPHAKCVVSDMPTDPDNVKKGIDRAIKRCGYPMTSSVAKGEVLITKKEERK
jgi:hypothetical protein